MYLKIKQHKETKERSAPHFVFKELYVTVFNIISYFKYAKTSNTYK